jgi:DNA polymerase III epsilon subunit-like protein
MYGWIIHLIFVTKHHKNILYNVFHGVGDVYKAMDCSVLIVIYDLETTGFYPSCIFSPRNKIIQISAATMVTNRPSIFYETYVDPKCDIHPLSTAIHGINRECVQGKPDIQHAFRDLCEKLCISSYEKVFFVAHNNNYFDEPVLRREMGGKIPPNILFWDSLPYLREKFPNLQSYTLENVYQYFFNRKLQGAHNAGNDVKALLEVCHKVVDQEAYETFTANTTVIKVTDFRYIGKYRAELIYKKLGIYEPNALKNYFQEHENKKALDKFLQQELNVTQSTDRVTLICSIYDIPLWDWGQITEHLFYSHVGYTDSIDYYLSFKLQQENRNQCCTKTYKNGLLGLNNIVHAKCK